MDKQILQTCPHLKVYKIGKYRKNNHYQKSIETITRIATEFPRANIRVIHLPMKGEVRIGKYLLDIGDDIRAAGVGYLPILDACDISTSMYHKNDSHPNDNGYSVIAECVY